ncbi:MAG: valine--tRNA ligase [Gammaproteobacteria bacterium]|nr:valine--tRNA ligase [Gammaproteobacteria bacterium]
MDKTYQPHAIETHWYARWEQCGYFAPQPQGAAYCIMIPPPNVTGSLHMGHAFQDTIMDALTRYHRMKGDNTLWQAGTDHAGIATQMVVERQLNAQGQTRHDLGRDGFIAKVWEWKAHSGGTITRQLRRIGASLDWSRERFTMDEGLSAAVQEVFVRLHEEDLIYRDKQLVNWDPVLQTAVSDLEVISQEESGHLWHLRYPLTDGSGHLIVATTRPETLLGDSAVAVHPNDERYKKFIGKQIRLPITNREIPIIADDYVDKEFGTGCVKITPAHDFNDYKLGKRHKLPLFCIFTKDAKIVNDEDWPMVNQNLRYARISKRRDIIDVASEIGIPRDYWGLDRFDARKKIVAYFEKEGLLEKIQPHKLMVPRGDRSQAVIEPYLTDQWYVKIAPLAEPAIKAVETGAIKFVPDNWKNTYFEWMRNIQDWCVSRQIWWGHRIPAWYDDRGTIYVARSETEVRKKYRLSDTLQLTQDDDVLDTWFSSALWPFSTLGWPQQTPELKTFYPTSVLVTGFDIIFFWVARMIMFGMKFTGEVPFREVYIHGLVRDSHGQKMSKSKGNVLDPIDLIDGVDLETLVNKRITGLLRPKDAADIEKITRIEYPNGIPAYGTDALRFTFAALASTGRDINFDLNRIEGYRNFCNKLWNAARYVLLNTEGKATGTGYSSIELSIADRWIVSRLQQTIQQVDDAIQQYRFDLMANALYEFTWNEYCDWYLELSKPVLVSETSSAAAKRGTRYTLIQVLETLLRLLHPIMPYITEDIWQRVAPLAAIQGATIMLQPFPSADRELIATDADADMEWVKQFILGVRQIRSGMDIKPSKPLPVLLQNGSDADRRRLTNNQHYIEFLARTESIRWLGGNDTAPEAATALLGNLKLLIPMAGLIDKHAESQRLQKEIDKKHQEKERLATKLANPNFVDKAPAAVVATERTRLAAMEAAMQQLTQQLEKISRL